MVRFATSASVVYGLEVAVRWWHRAWLLDETSLSGPTLRMEALGVVGTATDQDLPVPANLDLIDYRIIDISVEAHDGNAAHSGHSLLRGTLR
jgi:hypothetical protein